MLEQLTEIVTIAILVTAVVDVFKVENLKNRNYILSLVVGLVVAVFYGIDLFAHLGFVTTVPYVGSILTGLIVSKGGNFVHDIFKKISGENTELE